MESEHAHQVEVGLTVFAKIDIVEPTVEKGSPWQQQRYIRMNAWTIWVSWQACVKRSDWRQE